MSRSAPFTLSESMCLCECILKKNSVIENKDTSANTTQEKNKAWAEVTEEFNSLGAGGPRPSHSLQSRWKLLKKLARKDEAAERRELCKTGGGKPDIKKNLPESLKTLVLRIMSDLSIVGNRNAPDSNADFPLYYSQNVEEVIVDSELLDDDLLSNDALLVEDINNNPVAEESSTFIWKNYKPQTLKRKVSEPLDSRNVKKSTTSTTNFKQYQKNLSTKEDVLQKQSEHFTMMMGNEKKEDERKQREHELRMKLMLEKAEKEEKRAEEKHKLEMALLMRKAKNITSSNV